MRRTVRRTVARGMIAALLIAQMMVAAHACPAMSAQGGKGLTLAGAARPAVAAISDVAHQPIEMPADCEMTLASPNLNLCAAHCQAGDQNIDGTQTPAPPACLLSSLYVVQMTSLSSGTDRDATSSVVVYAIPPPHAILHCCFRI